MPPVSDAHRLYRKAPRVDSAVSRTTSRAATTAVMLMTRPALKTLLVALGSPGSLVTSLMSVLSESSTPRLDSRAYSTATQTSSASPRKIEATTDHRNTDQGSIRRRVRRARRPRVVGRGGAAVPAVRGGTGEAGIPAGGVVEAAARGGG